MTNTKNTNRDYVSLNLNGNGSLKKVKNLNVNIKSKLTTSDTSKFSNEFDFLKKYKIQ